jgi:hypothetical protein
LTKNERGAEYDPNFFGGVDELLPNDIPETIDGIDYPDHGELWTTALHAAVNGEEVTVFGKLQLSGLHYSKTVSLDKNAPVVFLDYRIRNDSGRPRHFLWKMHAALRIAEGDQLVTSASTGKVVDPQYSRFRQADEFVWPTIEGMNASIVPARTDEMDFFYLYDIDKPEMQLLSNGGAHLFSYRYDPSVFPYQWYFASFGGFLDHYTAILEPCTSMPMSVNEAAEKSQTAILQPGQTITTRVRIYAGEKKNYIS